MNPLAFLTKILPGIFHREFFQYSINNRIEGSVTSARFSPISAGFRIHAAASPSAFAGRMSNSRSSPTIQICSGAAPSEASAARCGCGSGLPTPVSLSIRTARKNRSSPKRSIFALCRRCFAVGQQHHRRRRRLGGIPALRSAPSKGWTTSLAFARKGIRHFVGQGCVVQTEFFKPGPDENAPRLLQMSSLPSRNRSLIGPIPAPAFIHGPLQPFDRDPGFAGIDGIKFRPNPFGGRGIIQDRIVQVENYLPGDCHTFRRRAG